MAHLGLGEYAVLMLLSDGESHAESVDGNKITIGEGGRHRSGVVNFLVENGLVTRADGALALSESGRTELDAGFNKKWIVDHSGLHEESQTYRFEVPDQVTGRRFVVSVAQEAGAALANRVAYSVIGVPSVRDSCRKLETIGPDGGFPVTMAVEGTGEITVWRKL